MIGVDIVRNSRVERMCGRYGYRFLAKFMTYKELEYMESLDKSAQMPYVIKCWAAKEACVKATKSGLMSDFALLKNGRLPYIETRLPYSIEVTLSDEDEYSVAFVFAWNKQ